MYSLPDYLMDELIAQEKLRQENEITLIASENYAPAQVLAAVGSVLTNKYAEGYPGKRYYEGCTRIDAVEQLTIDRACQLFKAEHANVQPHAGSQANLAAYLALLKPGQTILGMRLSDGGHLTHGHAVNVSGKIFNAIQYGVERESETIDYHQVEEMTRIHRPALLVAGASAYSRIIDFERFAHIARKYDALLLVDMAHIAGLVAAGLHPSPFPHADVVTSTTHKTLRGPRGGLILCKKKFADAVDRAIMPGTQGGPLLHVIAAKGIAFAYATQPSFVTYQQQVIRNAQAMAEEFQKRGYRIVSGGTDNHLFVVDLTPQAISGAHAAQTLDTIGITVSKSCIPFDTKNPRIGSGIRIGTAAATTRGLGQDEVLTLVDIIDCALRARPEQLIPLAERVRSLAQRFPLSLGTAAFNESTAMRAATASS